MQRSIRIVFFLGLLTSAWAVMAQMKPVLPSLPPPNGTPAPPGIPGVGQSRVTLTELRTRIVHIPKSMAVPAGEGHIRAVGVMNQVFELVGEDGNDYLVRMLPPEDPRSPLHRAWILQEKNEITAAKRAEFFADKYLVASLPDVTPPFTKKLVFERRDEGLPKSGHWQMSFDVADFNGDGLLDIVLAPARTGVSHPSIYLQQTDGTWRLWDQVRWPAIKFDYGSVRVADFDGDGNLDIALTCHFGDTYVLYGNGKGDFTRMVKLPKPNPAISARALTVADFNNDGRPDLATICEMDLDVSTNQVQHSGLVVVYLNLPGGWKAITEGFPAEIQGDWLSAADIDGDGWVDLLLTSRKEGVTDLFMRNVGKGTAFQPIASNQVPPVGFVFANAAAPLDRFKQPDVVLCFEQFDPFQVGPDPSQACAIYRFHDAKGKATLKPKPELLLKRQVAFDNFKGVAVGDIDGDGRNDIALITSTGAVKIFLQFPDGRFYEHLPEIKLEHTNPFDVRIVDLHHTGMGDVIVAGSPSGAERGGGVWVFSPHRLEAVPEQAKARP